MAEIKVSTSEIRNKLGELRQLNQQFKSKVEALVASENTLSGQWEGDAKTAFHTAFNNDKAQWDAFAQLIENYAVALETIASEYDQKEATNANIASQRNY